MLHMFKKFKFTMRSKQATNASGSENISIEGNTTKDSFNHHSLSPREDDDNPEEDSVEKPTFDDEILRLEEQVTQTRLSLDKNHAILREISDVHLVQEQQKLHVLQLELCAVTRQMALVERSILALQSDQKKTQIELTKALDGIDTHKLEKFVTENVDPTALLQRYHRVKKLEDGKRLLKDFLQFHNAVDKFELLLMNKVICLKKRGVTKESSSILRAPVFVKKRSLAVEETTKRTFSSGRGGGRCVADGFGASRKIRGQRESRATRIREAITGKPRRTIIHCNQSDSSATRNTTAGLDVIELLDQGHVEPSTDKDDIVLSTVTEDERSPLLETLV